MRTGDLDVVVLHRNGVENLPHERFACRSAHVVSEFDANQQFRRRDRGDSNIVAVADEPAEAAT